MEIKIEDWVQWSFPTDNIMMKVDSTDVNKLKYPPGVLFFRFFKIASAEAEVNGKKVYLSSEPIIESNQEYFYGGQELTIEQIETELEDARLSRKLNKMGFKRATRTRFGSIIGLNDNQTVLTIRKDQEYTPEEFDAILKDIHKTQIEDEPQTEAAPTSTPEQTETIPTDATKTN